MKKNKFLKFISIFQIITFTILALAGAVALAYALFEKFNVTVVLDFVNNKLWFIEEYYLYVINFFNTIYLSLEINKLEFVAKLVPYLNIIYTGIFVFITMLALIFAIVSLRTANGKTKGRAGTIFSFFINLLIAGAFIAFAVYFTMYAEAIENVVNDEAIPMFAREGFKYAPIINKVIIYAVAGLPLFITLFHFIALCTLRKDGATKKENAPKASSKDYGSYNPRMKLKEEDKFEINKPAETMKYQDSKSSNPYINGKAELAEDDLFGDLFSKPKTEPVTTPKPQPAPAPKPMPMPASQTNNPFASPARPTPINNPYPYNSFTQQNQYNTYAAPAQNQFNRPMPYNQPAQPQSVPAQPQPTNINLTIQAAPGQTPTVVQSAATTPAKPKAAPKSANEAFKATPKAPTQAVARVRQTPQINLTDKLKELSALRQSGAISDDEYKALKQKAFQKFLKS